MTYQDTVEAPDPGYAVAFPRRARPDWHAAGSDAVFRGIFDAAPCAILAIAPDGRIAFANRSASRLFGYGPAELEGLAVERLFPGDACPDVTAPVSLDVEGRRRDGTTFPIVVRSEPANLNGIDLVVATVLDATERLWGDAAVEHPRAEAAVRSPDARLGGVIAHLSQGVALWDPDDRLVIWNAAYERFVPEAATLVERGVEFESIVRAVASARATSGNFATAEEHVVRRMARHGESGEALELVRPDGVEFILHERRLADGSTIETFTDITELKSRERDLARVVEDVEQFAYIASHDLRTPLRGIANLVEWIAEDLGESPPGDVAHNLERMHDRVGRMEALIEGVLAFSRAGRPGVPAESVDVGALVAEMIDEIDFDPGFEIEIAPAMPVIETGRAPLESVLRQIVGNAFAHHDRGQGWVRVGARVVNSRVCFEVCDDGPGIPEAQHERAFQIFQVLSPNCRERRSGIGLAIAKRIVGAAGGKMSIHVTDGARGTTLAFDWPLVWN